MGLFRLLFWIALIAAGIWLWRRLSRPRATPRRSTAEAPPMVRCAHCGMHVPASEALSSEERWYCSRPHLEQGPKRP